MLNVIGQVVVVIPKFGQRFRLKDHEQDLDSRLALA